LDIKEETLYNEGAETLDEVAQRGGRCPILGSVQGQAGWALSHLV